MSKEKLSEYIKIKGLTSKLKPSSVDHYLIFEFKEATKINELDLDEIHKNNRSGSKYMAVSCRWRDILNAQLSSY